MPSPKHGRQSYLDSASGKSRDSMRCAALMEARNILIVGIDRRGRITCFNKGCEAATGYSSKEVIGKSFTANLIAKEQRKTVRNQLRALTASKAHTEFTSTMITRAGEQRVVRWITAAVLDSKDMLWEIILTGTDVTEVTTALRESEEKYRMLVDRSIQGTVILLGNPLKIDFANEAFAQMIGYTVDELTALSPPEIQALVHPEDRVYAFERSAARFRGESVFERWEFRMFRKDGTIIWTEVFANRIDYHGRPAIQATFMDITERKRAEAALQESEAKWRSLVEYAPDLVMMLDQEGIIHFINQVVTGQSIDEVIGRSAFEFVSPEHHSTQRLALEHVFETGEPTRFEVTAPGPNDTVAWYQVRVGPVVQDGKVIAAIQIGRDITAQKQAEKAVQDSEAQYRMLVEQSIQGTVILLGTPFSIVFSNQAFARMLGYTVDELTSLSLQEIQERIHPEDRTHAFERISARLRGKALSPSWEFRLIRKDRTTIWVEMLSSRIEYHGQPAAQAIFINITERKQMEMALRESEEKYRELAEKSFQAITVFQDGRVVYANQAAPEIVDMSLEEFLALGALEWAQFVHPDDRELVLGRFQARVKGQEAPRHYQFRVIPPTGELKWMEVMVSRIYWEGRIAVQAVMLDITERKRAEQALRQAQAQAEFFNDLMAHDLTNINQGILSLLELVLREPDLSSTPAELLSKALMQLQRGTDLIAKVKRFALVDGAPLALQTTDVAQPFSAAVETVRGSYPDKELLLRTSITPEKYYVLANEFLVDVFYNLLHNAMKFDRQKRVKITVSVREMDDFLRVEVEDYGSGITDIEKAKIFARFGTGEAKSQVGRGRGIGLTLVQRIVSHYSGKIWVEDRVPGDYKQGAKFVILLPRAMTTPTQTP